MKPRLDPRLRHRLADRLTTPVDNDGPHADGFHKDDVEQELSHRDGILERAPADLDHDIPVTELAYPAECLNEHARFTNGIIQCRKPRRCN